MTTTPKGQPRIPYQSTDLIERLDELNPIPKVEPGSEIPTDRELLIALARRGLVDQLIAWLDSDREKGLHV
jgi:hypothetical protein